MAKKFGCQQYLNSNTVKESNYLLHLASVEVSSANQSTVIKS